MTPAFPRLTQRHLLLILLSSAVLLTALVVCTFVSPSFDLAHANSARFAQASIQYGQVWPQVGLLLALQSAKSAPDSEDNKARSMEVLRRALRRCTGYGIKARRAEAYDGTGTPSKLFFASSERRLAAISRGQLRVMDIDQLGRPWESEPTANRLINSGQILLSAVLDRNGDRLLTVPTSVETAASLDKRGSGISSWTLTGSAPIPSTAVVDTSLLPNDPLIVEAKGDHVAVGGVQGGLRLYFADTSQGTPVFRLGYELRGLRNKIRNIAISGNGEWVAASDADNSVAYWRLPVPQPSQPANLQHHIVETDSNAIESSQVTFSKDSSLLIVPVQQDVPEGGPQPADRKPDEGGEEDPALQTAKTGPHLLIALSDGTPQSLRPSVELVSRATSASADADGLAQAYEGGTIDVWTQLSDPTKRKLQSFKLDKECGWSETITALAFAPNASRLAVGAANGNVCAFSLDHPAPASKPAADLFPGQEERIVDLLYSDSGELLAGLSVNGSVRIWKLERPFVGFAYLRAREEHRSLPIFFQDNEYELAAVASKDSIMVWDLRDWEALDLRGTQRELTETPVSIAFHPDGKILAVALKSGTLLMWKWDSNSIINYCKVDATIDGIEYSNAGNYLALHYRGDRMQYLDMRELSKTPYDLPNASLFSFIADDRLLRVPNDGTPVIENLLSNSRQNAANSEIAGWPTQLTVHPTGRWMAIGYTTGDVALYPLDDQLTAGSPEILQPREAAPPLPPLRIGRICSSLAFSDSSNFLSAGFNTGEIAIWDLQGSSPILQDQWPAHAAAVTSLTIAQGGRRLLTGDQRGEVRVWAVRDRRLEDVLPSVEGDRAVRQIYVNEAHDTLVTSYSHGTVAAWWLAQQELEGEAAKAAGRELTDIEKAYLVISNGLRFQVNKH